MSKDDIYANALESIADFRFDERVAKVFPDMVTRSVPGYENITELVGVIGKEFAQPESTIYDLGTSLGACLASIMSRVHTPSVRFIGVDNSQSMITRAETILQPFNVSHDVQLLAEDVHNVDIDNASVVVLNFTLQFVDVDKRDALIAKIYQGLRPNGVLVVSEKLAFADAQISKDFQLIHEGFKRDQGYSDLEISQKREALENVMIVDTQDTHIARLQAAGFTRVTRCFQYLQFASFIAFKS